MKKTLLLAVLAGIAHWVSAQIQSPEEFLGYKLGDRFTYHHRVIAYYEHVAANSDLVELMEYGTTNEGRPLVLAMVSSTDNLSNLETIRRDNLRRAGLESGQPATQIPLAWLSYNVHGNEANSTEASMLTLYKLLTEKQDWLETVVVILDPCINPDGRDRYVNFYNQVGQQPFNPDPQSSEHLEPWPGGRQNHYLFDLNRDWAWQTQVESRARMAVYKQWLPHVHVDFHEQGYNSPYYFAPAAEPYHELITDWQREFQTMIGKNHARYFDANNWFYFTKQSFDLLYPSYGDTYPTYLGAIGMTYEQAGHGRGGLGIIKQEGDTLTLLDRLTHHTTTGLSTVEMVVKEAPRVLQEFETYFNTPVKGTYKSFILRTSDQDKLAHLTNWLDLNGIEYGTSSSSKSLRGFNYATKQEETFSVRSTDLVVCTEQPFGILAKVLFEPVTALSDSLTYDITAWSVPYFYGVEAYATSTSLPITPSQQATFQPAEAPATAYAFLFEWRSLRDARLLAELLKNEIKVRFNDTPFTSNGITYPRGTIIVAKRDNGQLGDAFETTITRIANEQEQTFAIATTGFMQGGPDMGSRNVHYLNRPEVAMFRGDGVYVTDYGAAWHYLEKDLGYPFSALNTDDLGWVDLDPYDVIILQEGSYRNFRESGMKKIEEWVKDGGRLVLMGEAITSFADADWTSIKEYANEMEESLGKEREDRQKEEAQLAPYSEGRRLYAKRMIPGAIYKVKLDPTHPMAYGYGSTYYSLKTSSNRYGYLDAQNVGIIPSSEYHMSGFAGQYVREAMAKSLVFGVERKGSGEIVYFVDNPLFRNFWYNSKLMVANAIFMVGN